jgi:RimJ/RimL family protein N-acetyltransferase
MNLREPNSLIGKHVRLDPLQPVHFDELCKVGLDEDLWRWFPVVVRSREELIRWLEVALADQRKGLALPFAIVHAASSAVIGTSRFANIASEHRRLEIGWTWIVRDWQRTAVNTETKYLMLRHAFENLNCVRVEFKTDSLNHRSRAALLRIGAIEEGTLRQHMVTNSGRIRDSVYFSVVQAEWPGVKARLEEKLAR